MNAHNNVLFLCGCTEQSYNSNSFGKLYDCIFENCTLGLFPDWSSFFFCILPKKDVETWEKGSAVFLIFFLQTRFKQNWLTIVFLLPISVVYGELFVNFWWMFQLLDINDPSLSNKFWLFVNNESFFQRVKRRGEF